MTTATPHEELRDLLDHEVMPAHRARWGDTDSWEARYDFSRRLAEAGWTAPRWPVELGGRGLSVEEQLACDAELNRVRAPMQVAVFGVNNVGPTIAAVGTPEQRRHLDAILTLDEVWCQGFSEPDAGSDLAGLRCAATLYGDTFVVDGSKVWTSIGMWATHCMLLVRSDPDAERHRGISALLVPLDLAGITRRPIVSLDGRADFAELHFDGVEVPRSGLLGPRHEGWRVAMTTLGYERAGVIAEAGKLVDAVGETVARLAASDRLGPVLRDRAAALHIDARLLALLGARSLAEADGPPGAISSVIKLAWSNLGQRLAELAADADGMDAVAGDAMDGGKRLLASRSLSIAGGTTEIVKNLIAERSLGLPRHPG